MPRLIVCLLLSGVCVLGPFAVMAWWLSASKPPQERGIGEAPLGEVPLGGSEGANGRRSQVRRAPPGACDITPLLGVCVPPRARGGWERKD